MTIEQKISAAEAIRIKELEELLKLSSTRLKALGDVIVSTQAIYDTQIKDHDSIKRRLKVITDKHELTAFTKLSDSVVQLFAELGHTIVPDTKVAKRDKYEDILSQSFKLNANNTGYHTLSILLSNQKLTVYGCPKSFLGDKSEQWPLNGLKALKVSKENASKIIEKVLKVVEVKPKPVAKTELPKETAPALKDDRHKRELPVTTSAVPKSAVKKVTPKVDTETKQ